MAGEAPFSMDYACLNPKDDKWYGADHIHDPNGKLGPMTIKVYPNLAAFYAQCKKFQDFDAAVVCVTCREKGAKEWKQ